LTSQINETASTLQTIYDFSVNGVGSMAGVGIAADGVLFSGPLSAHPVRWLLEAIEGGDGNITADPGITFRGNNVSAGLVESGIKNLSGWRPVSASVSRWATIGSLLLYPELQDMGEAAGANTAAARMGELDAAVHFLVPQWQWVLKGPVEFWVFSISFLAAAVSGALGCPGLSKNLWLAWQVIMLVVCIVAAAG
jgi:hypothetical protein